VTDPFDVLRTPVSPVDPDPPFAARLRARIERALALPSGVAVTASTLAPDPAAVPAAGAAIPYLAVRGAEQALDWYVEVLGARRRGQPIVMPDGRIGHAELDLAGGSLYLAEEHPEIGVVAPAPDRATVSLVLAVPDVDAVVERATGAGGDLTRPPAEAHGMRTATVVDPFGHRWLLQTPLAASAATSDQAGYRPGDYRPGDYRPGDIGYVSVWTLDADSAAQFYAGVLGWTTTPGPEPQGRQVTGTTPPVGIWGGQERGTLFCCFAVDDVAAATRRVRAAGGQADEPVTEPYGLVANCVDDQGTRFAVYEVPAGGTGGGRPPANGARPGDLAYLTLTVVDSAQARAFYGEVLGWRFSPGRVEDGWQVEDVVPMTGLSGGHPQATGVPMWLVEDIAAAVQRVRDAGGTSTEPQRQPYGVMADCTDDQGMHFYLGQL
jgi:predicted enzyme related to lactoylglutathione lyase